METLSESMRRTTCPGEGVVKGLVHLVNAGGVIPLARRLVDELACLPYLEHEDPIGLTMLAISNLLVRTVHPRNKSIDTNLIADIEAFSLQVVIVAHPDAARRAGVLSPVHAPLEALAPGAGRWWGRWRKRLRVATDAAQRANWRVNPDTRDGALAYMWQGLPPVVAEGRTLVEDLRQGVRLAKGKRALDIDEDASPLELAGLHLELAVADGADLGYVSEDGEFRIGARQVRDKLAPRKSPHATSLHEEGPGGHAPLQALPGTEPLPPDAVAAVQDIGAVKASIEAVRAARAARARPGSARGSVLSRLQDLLDGRLSLTQLAHETGLALSSLSEAFDAEKQVLAAHLRSRGLA
jgi:hypothetical protein